MEQFVEVNLNHHIRVKLNDKGKSLYNNRYSDKFSPSLLAQLNIKPLVIDHEGYSQFQLHEFMEIFGNHFGPSAQDIPIESMNVMVQRNNL